MHQSFPSHADPAPAGSVPPSATSEAGATGHVPPSDAAGPAAARGGPEGSRRERASWPVRPALLGDPLPDLPEADAVGFAGVRRDWEARLTPIDEAERAVSDTFACAAWRRRRLDAVDERVLRALARGEVPAGMPSLETLIRYRARLAKDSEVLKAELGWLWRLRPLAISLQNRNPARRDWLIEMASLIRPGWRTDRRNADPEAASSESGPEPAEPGLSRAADVEPAPAEPAGSGSPSTADPRLRSEPARAPRPVAPEAGPAGEAPRPAPEATDPPPTRAPVAREPQPPRGPGGSAAASTDRAPAAAAASGPGGVPPDRAAQAAPERSCRPSAQEAAAGGPTLSPFARSALERPVPTLASLRAAVAAAARRAASG